MQIIKIQIINRNITAAREHNSAISSAFHREFRGSKCVESEIAAGVKDVETALILQINLIINKFLKLQIVNL